MSRHIELNPTNHVTVGTIGPPGQRTFYLQGSRGIDVVSLIIEKQQASILARSLESLLSELSIKYPREGHEEAHNPVMDMRLRQPVEPLFRVGNMGLGYNEDIDRVVLVAYELVDDEEEPNVVSFWITRAQVKVVAHHALEVVKAGRPICGNCGRPIEVDGIHFCPQRNGHIV
ncbi:MAG TPA: DUF3090 domain-containing protein [Anaerolineae bacterium]|nr:DUF3090 domain-containing protein [Anaerolineae bacterium]